MATVRIDRGLGSFGPGPRWESRAETVTGLLIELEKEYSRLRLMLRDEGGALRRSVRVFVNGADIRNGAGDATPLGVADAVEILRAIPGG